jgi:hypothetical protein
VDVVADGPGAEFGLVRAFERGTVGQRNGGGNGGFVAWIGGGVEQDWADLGIFLGGVEEVEISMISSAAGAIDRAGVEAHEVQEGADGARRGMADDRWKDWVGEVLDVIRRLEGWARA